MAIWRLGEQFLNFLFAIWPWFRQTNKAMEYPDMVFMESSFVGFILWRTANLYIFNHERKKIQEQLMSYLEAEVVI